MPKIDNHLPFLLPWLRVNLVMRQIRATTWDSVTWPTAKQALKDSFALQARMRRRAWWN